MVRKYTEEDYEDEDDDEEEDYDDLDIPKPIKRPKRKFPKFIKKKTQPEEPVPQLPPPRQQQQQPPTRIEEVVIDNRLLNAKLNYIIDLLEKLNQ